MSDVVFEGSREDRGRELPTSLPAVIRRTSWGAVGAGAVVAVGVQMLLTLLGLAIGTTTTDAAANPGDRVQEGISIAAGVWWLITGTAALFVGGCVVGRFAGMVRSPDLVLHGFTMWAVTALFGFITVTSGAGALYGMNTAYVGASTYELRTQPPSPADSAASTVISEDAATAGPRPSPDQIQSYVRTASWWSLLGFALGIGASLVGSWAAAPNRIVMRPPSVG